MSNSSLLNLPYLQPAQAQKHVTHNEALTVLDALVQLSVLSAVETVPPASPLEGDRYVVASGATLGWSGHEAAIATWVNGGWQFYFPQTGWIAFDQNTQAQIIFDGSIWAPLKMTLNNLPGLGIGATYDATNVFSMSGAASLFNHAGAGHQMKLNKASDTETSSLLYQSNWSGRAEAGLAGNDDYSIKVSDDGSSFQEALRISSTTGIMQIKSARSGLISLNDDTATSIATPADAGMIVLMRVDQSNADQSGIFAYHNGSNPSLVTMSAGAGMDNLGVQALSGTNGTDGHSGIAVQSGAIHLENRSGATAQFSYTFLG